MRITGCEIRYFSIPFSTPVAVAGQQLKHREGFVVSLADNRLKRGFGEAAPLPGLDLVSLAQCHDELCQIADHLREQPLEAAGFDMMKPMLGLAPVEKALFWNQLSAVARFGLESALLSLFLQHHPQMLSSFGSRLLVPVNALFIPSENPEEIDRQLLALRKAGFKTVKVKIGRIDPDLETKQIRQLAGSFSNGLKLRLDGNRSLSYDAYRSYHEALKSLPVEYVEEPLPTDIWEKGLSLSWPLALDESLSGFLDKESRLVNLPAPIHHIILKPSTAPGVHGLYRLLADARSKGVHAVLSSAFNTGLGLSTLGLISSLTAAGARTAHGLDTLKYLSGDLLARPLNFNQGNLDLPVSLFTSDIELNQSFLGEGPAC